MDFTRWLEKQSAPKVCSVVCGLLSIISIKFLIIDPVFAKNDVEWSLWSGMIGTKGLPFITTMLLSFGGIAIFLVSTALGKRIPKWLLAVLKLKANQLQKQEYVPIERMKAVLESKPQIFSAKLSSAMRSTIESSERLTFLVKSDGTNSEKRTPESLRNQCLMITERTASAFERLHAQWKFWNSEKMISKEKTNPVLLEDIERIQSLNEKLKGLIDSTENTLVNSSSDWDATTSSIREVEILVEVLQDSPQI